MTRKVPTGFERDVVRIAIAAILPLRPVPAHIREGRKYTQIASSVREVGIVQPPVVARHASLKGKYLLLDGHLRIEVLKDMSIREVTCLVSLDDEAFTYNRQINRLATIQEHRMILKLVERGISEKRIAEALDVDVAAIRVKRNLLRGICPEVEKLLKDKHCPINTFQALRSLKRLRQIEVAELMVSTDDYSVLYAKALVAATPLDQLVDEGNPKPLKGVSPEQMEQIQRELINLQGDVKRIEGTFASDHLNLVLATSYVRSLLGNDRIDRYLDKYHPELRQEFHKICDATALISEAAE